MLIVRGTTPTLTLQIPGYDLTGSDVFVTIRQNMATITKTGADVAMSVSGGNTELTSVLSQNDTLI
jgi:hypothetical protein